MHHNSTLFYCQVLNIFLTLAIQIISALLAQFTPQGGALLSVQN